MLHPRGETSLSKEEGDAMLSPRTDLVVHDPAPLPGVPVRLWRVDLAERGPVDRLALDFLPAGEQWRAHRGTEQVRRRRVLLRIALRQVLGQLLSVAPADVPLAEVAGRPTVTAGDSDLSVSCSAAGQIGLVAVAEGMSVGVDLEPHANRRLADALDEGWLHPAEVDRLAALPRGRRALALTRCWTQKEAVLKGLGVGLARHPRTVRTPCADSGIVEGWTVAPVPVPDSHVAALAVRKRCA
jgi:4'-phosphopantetheinyl transferase